MTCYFCSWFADNFFLLQTTRTNDKRNQVQPGYVRPWACFHHRQTCPSGIKTCRGGRLVKIEKFPRELLLTAQDSFFLLCFVIKGTVSPHTWSPIAKPFLQSRIKLILENPSWWVFYASPFSGCNTGEVCVGRFPIKISSVKCTSHVTLLTQIRAGGMSLKSILLFGRGNPINSLAAELGLQGWLFFLSLLEIPTTLPAPFKSNNNFFLLHLLLFLSCFILEEKTSKQTNK